MSHQTVQQLLLEKEQALADLNSVEKSLADLFRRYEKMKEVLEGFRKVREQQDGVSVCGQGGCPCAGQWGCCWHGPEQGGDQGLDAVFMLRGCRGLGRYLTILTHLDGVRSHLHWWFLGFPLTPGPFLSQPLSSAVE